MTGIRWYEPDRRFVRLFGCVSSSRPLRLLGLSSLMALVTALLVPFGQVAAAQGARHAVVAAPGEGPVAVSLPLISLPYHGNKPGERPPVIPPPLHSQPSAAGTVASPVRTKAPSAPRGGGGGGGGGGTGPQATNLHLLPGLAVGDTS